MNRPSPEQRLSTPMSGEADASESGTTSRGSVHPWPDDRRNPRAYEQILARLVTLSQAVASAADLATVYRGVRDFAVASGQCNGLYVSLFDSERELRTCVYAFSEGREEDVSALPPMPLTSSPASRAVSSGEIIVTDDFQSAIAGQPRVDLGLDLDPRLPQSAISVPMTVLGRTIGVFEVQSIVRNAYTEEHVTAMRMAASVAAIAIENLLLLERERAQRQAAQAAEETYRLLFRNNPRPMWVFDLETLRYVAVNTAAVLHYGYSEEEFLAMTVRDLRPTEDVPRLVEMLNNETGRRESGLWRHRKKNGEVIDVEISSDAIVFEGRRARLVLANDVTERLRATRANALQARILDSIGQAVIVSDGEARIIYVNRFAWELYGWTGEEMIGRLITETLVPSGGQTQAAEILARLQSGQSWSGEFQACRRDGSTFPAAIVSSPLLDRHGALVGMIGISTDITERTLAAERLKQSESMLRIAGRAARLGGWVVTLPVDRVVWSEEVCAIHEVPAGTSPTVEEAIAFYAPEWRDTIAGHFWTCVRDGTPFDDELEIITAKGRRVWVRAIGEAERDPDGGIRCVQGAFQDISALKQAEAATREIGARLTTALESMTDAFVTLDTEWRFTYVNREAERLLRRTRGALLGRVMWDEFEDSLGSTFEREYRRAVRENCTVSFQEYYPPLGKWFDLKGYPSPEGLAVYFRDVTAQRAEHEQLRLSQDRFRLLAKATHDAIYDWNVGTGEVWWNEGFETLFGYDRQSEDASSHSWKKRVHPDDVDRVTAGLGRAVERGDDLWTGEYRFRRRDGSYAYVLDRGHMIKNEAGVVARIIGGMTDMTERTEAEEKLREQAALLDNARDGIVVRDLQHVIHFWNKGAERLYGWSATEVTGLRLDELMKIPAAQFRAAEHTLLTTGEWTGELDKTSRSGAALVLNCRWTLLRTPAGEPKSILSIDTDITDRKRLEVQFLRAQRMESIGTLAGGIAHDLNNLLAPITMAVDLLKQEKISRENAELIEIVERSAKRSANLVRQVLSFARGVEGARVAVQIRHVVTEIAGIVENTFPKNIRFETSLPRDSWAVLGDPTQVQQVLLNLCVNARDAMPDGGQLQIRTSNVVVDAQHLAAHRAATAGRFVAIEVEDSGTGIPKEIIEKIFEPFFTTKETGRGSGLGLATTLGIVRSHKGFIEVDSEIDRGSTFRVFLPAHTQDAAKAPDQVAQAFPRGNGELVLVVDDEPSVLTVTSQTLETFGYRVLTAENGAEAVSIVAIERENIALVITDMMMPVMDGPAAVVAIRKIHPTVKIIGASGLDTKASTRAINAGIVRFLAKPYSAGTMLALVRETLAGE